MSSQVDCSIFDGSPKTLVEDMVPPPALSVPANLNLYVAERFDKL